MSTTTTTLPAYSSFTGKVALVTGATSGIGRAAALALGRVGAKVVASGRRTAEGQSLVAEIKKAGGTATFFAADTSKESEIAALVAFTLKTYGRLDLAFNNAGVETGAAVTDVTEADYRRVFDLNVWGVLASMKHEIAAMLKTGGGSIVNTSSIAGHIGLPGASIYIASKHAVEGLTKVAALEVAKQNIRVNAVAPGAIYTEMFERFTGGQKANQDYLTNLHPVGRVGQVEDIARGVLYLLDPANTFVTGTSLAIEGGFMAQ
jgi:NAD(P)-dependent dehydrogenase (short-subunit alcohol dehydrogenase family)